MKEATAQIEQWLLCCVNKLSLCTRKAKNGFNR